MSPRVRVLLALALLLSLAGCSAAGSLSMGQADDADLADHASRSLPPPADAHEGKRAERVDRRRVVVDAVENGSAVVSGRGPPIETEGFPFAVDGAYYDLDVEQVGEHTETGVDLRIDYNGTTDGPAVAYEDLSPADRELVGSLLPPKYDRRVEGYDVGTNRVYNDSEAENSVLLAGDYEAVRYEGERYPIRVETDEVTVTEYRYTATEIAGSTSEYADLLREKSFTLSGLSEAEREVVDEAVDEGRYYADSTSDDAFESVMERFLAQDAVRRDEYHGYWVVRYEGTLYWAELRYDGFDVGTDAGNSGQETEAV